MVRPHGELESFCTGAASLRSIRRSNIRVRLSNSSVQFRLAFSTGIRWGPSHSVCRRLAVEVA